MSWYYADAGRQVGPVEETALDDLVRAGVVRDDTLVWREGMANWQPHGSARGPKPAAADACGSHRSRFQFLLRMRTPVSFGATGRAG